MTLLRSHSADRTFYSLVAYLRKRIGPTLRNLGCLAVLFIENRWPKPWLHNIVWDSIQSEQPVLRDFDVLLLTFDNIGRPETIMRRIIYTCAEHDLPVEHCCIHKG